MLEHLLLCKSEMYYMHSQIVVFKLCFYRTLDATFKLKLENNLSSRLKFDGHITSAGPFPMTSSIFMQSPPIWHSMRKANGSAEALYTADADSDLCLASACISSSPNSSPTGIKFPRAGSMSVKWGIILVNTLAEASVVNVTPQAIVRRVEAEAMLFSELKEALYRTALWRARSTICALGCLFFVSGAFIFPPPFPSSTPSVIKRALFSLKT